MTLASTRSAIAAYYLGALPKTEQVFVSEYGGAFTLEEIMRIGKQTPALIVTCLGVAEMKIQGNIPVASAAWAAFVVCKDSSRIKKDVQVLTLTEAVMADLPHQRWGDLACSRPNKILATNLYSAALDKVGIAMWAVRWLQDVELTRPTDLANLTPFETFFATWDIDDESVADTPITEVQVDLEQP